MAELPQEELSKETYIQDSYKIVKKIMIELQISENTLIINMKWSAKSMINPVSHQTFICSKATIKTRQKGVKYTQS